MNIIYSYLLICLTISIFHLTWARCKSGFVTHKCDRLNHETINQLGTDFGAFNSPEIIRSTHARSASSNSTSGAKTHGIQREAGGVKFDRNSQECIEAHNHYRSLHGVPKLISDDKIADWARIRSREIVRKFEHSIDTTENYGESLAMTTERDKSCKEIIAGWYAQMANHNFNDPDFNPKTGHFTQLVWKSTKKIGCSHYTIPSGTYVVCGYYPPGNEIGRFRENVNKPKKQHTTSSTRSTTTTTKKPKSKRKGRTTSKRPLSLKPDKMKIQQDCLHAHNHYRSLHNASKLVLNQSIIDWAETRARQIVGKFEHVPNSPYGENLAMITKPRTPCRDLVKMWYDEIKDYNFDKAQFSHTTGHFTQLIWKGTTELGCGYFVSPKGTFLSCGYKPHGNVIGAFKENLEPLWKI